MDHLWSATSSRAAPAKMHDKPSAVTLRTLNDPLTGIVSSSVVTLRSIQIFKSHEWLTSEPTIYFHCQGENKTILPDVKKTYFLYTFKGAESWQKFLVIYKTCSSVFISYSTLNNFIFHIHYPEVHPLAELIDQKCKRCGLYEKDSIKSDDVFDEWELCPDDFLAPDGKYLRVKEKEFNLTLSCRQCLPLEPNSVRTPSSPSESNDKGMYVLLVILISALVSVVSVIGFIYGYNYWQKRKREKEQAQFLKLFEDGDDIEDELGLEHDMI
ncbi:putative transmembrane protein [Cinnamomum micranthum f. kanehirae]|uniref:Putative transmembrane protein n=1 Tax=Cinnamomum micranthum f. kanehirae TaxID=337451 RepID=A0A443P5E4_9MAGN|nr:putative transmembrane protein [Cinnamomum micranthum f. kanehirae]